MVAKTLSPAGAALLAAIAAVGQAAAQRAAPQGGRDGSGLVNLLDTNHDGVISPEEFDAARNRLLPNRGGRGLDL